MTAHHPASANLLNEPATLVELLRFRALGEPDRLAYTFLVDGEVEEARITFAELDRQARAIAAWLQGLGAAGERALLLYPPGLEYIAAFFGCLYAGVIAVPAYPPRLNRPVPRIQSIVADSQASVALTTSQILASLEQRFEYTPDLQALRWLDTERLPQGQETDWVFPAITPNTLAFLQYTSGSTRTPRGVMLSHENLIYNLKMIQRGFQLGPDSLGVIWLPSYHDMGLIGGILGPLYAGGGTVLMAPYAFLQRPVRWLQALSRFKGRVSGAPNFAYDLCVEKVTPEQRADLDLSSWQVAFSGAEPVRKETLERFAEAFAPCGFRSQVYYPCYGLAEATLFVTGADGPGEPRICSIQRSALERDLVVEIQPEDADALTMVGCGHVMLEQQIVIANPHTLRRCPEGEVGEIWISGKSVAQGYWNRLEESQRTFQAYLADTSEGPFLRTGDLGFLQDGELFITGRLKDLIIIRGSNHYPQDIELTVDQCHPALQPNAGAAFSIQLEGEECLVVVQEVARQHRHSNLEEVMRAIRRAVSENHDLQVYAIALVRPLSVPKTSSGKIQRHACKASFLAGSLEVIEEWRAPLRTHNELR